MSAYDAKLAGYQRGRAGLRVERGPLVQRFAYISGWSQGWREYQATQPKRVIVLDWGIKY